MALDLKTVQRPFRKLRKVVSGIGESPLPEDIHAFRTLFRRVEAIALALQFEQKQFQREFLAPFKPIRKAAGAVRDMDVLAELASSLDHEADGSRLLPLIDHLGRRRAKAAAKLHKAVVAREMRVRKSLKNWSSHAEEVFRTSTMNVSFGQRVSIGIVSLTLQLQAELRSWPQLNAENMHPFRLKVKELRDILALSPNSNPQFAQVLGEVKDQIGAWHDWASLAEMAVKIFKHEKERAICKKIRERADAEFLQASEAAHSLQALYLHKKPVQGERREVTGARTREIAI